MRPLSYFRQDTLTVAFLFWETWLQPAPQTIWAGHAEGSGAQTKCVLLIVHVQFQKYINIDLHTQPYSHSRYMAVYKLVVLNYMQIVWMIDSVQTVGIKMNQLMIKYLVFLGMSSCEQRKRQQIVRNMQQFADYGHFTYNVLSSYTHAVFSQVQLTKHCSVAFHTASFSDSCMGSWE